jgi:hypothetical protein
VHGVQKVDSQKRSVLGLPNSGDVATGCAVGVCAHRFPGSGSACAGARSRFGVDWLPRCVRAGSGPIMRQLGGIAVVSAGLVSWGSLPGVGRAVRMAVSMAAFRDRSRDVVPLPATHGGS